jgi:hypothetical protein
VCNVHDDDCFLETELGDIILAPALAHLAKCARVFVADLLREVLPGVEHIVVPAETFLEFVVRNCCVEYFVQFHVIPLFQR